MANIDEITEKLDDIGDAIRSKTAQVELLSLDEMPDAIRSISGGGGFEVPTVELTIEQVIEFSSDMLFQLTDEQAEVLKNNYFVNIYANLQPYYDFKAPMVLDHEADDYRWFRGLFDTQGYYVATLYGDANTLEVYQRYFEISDDAVYVNNSNYYSGSLNRVLDEIGAEIQGINTLLGSGEV